MRKKIKTAKEDEEYLEGLAQGIIKNDFKEKSNLRTFLYVFKIPPKCKCEVDDSIFGKCPNTAEVTLRTYKDGKLLSKSYYCLKCFKGTF